MAVDINIFKSAYTAEQIKKALNFYKSQIADPYSSASAYSVDDFVVYNGFLYQCISEVSAGSEWDASKWQIQKIFDNNGNVILK